MKEIKCLRGHRHIQFFVAEKPKEELLRLDCVPSLIDYLGSVVIKDLSIDYYLIRTSLQQIEPEESLDYETFQVFYDEDDYEAEE